MRKFRPKNLKNMADKKMNEFTEVTSVSRLLGLNSSGDSRLITPANLANSYQKDLTGINLNTLSTLSFGLCGQGNSMTNEPFDGTVALAVIHIPLSYGYAFQIGFNLDSGAIKIRSRKGSSAAWGSWKSA